LFVLNTSTSLAKARNDPRATRRIKDACDALSISRSTLYKLEALNKVRLVRILGRTLVPESEIERLSSEGAE
jgi:hypothetical protein